MSNWVLRTSDGTHRSVNEGASCDILVTLVDTGGQTVETGMLSSVQLSLMLPDGTVINSRSEQEVLGVNGGSVTSGVLEIKLDPLDNIIVDSTLAAGSVEKHLAQVTYSWTDIDGDSRTNVETFEFSVWKKVDPA